MNSSRWNLLVLGLLGLFAAIVVGSSYRMDIFGIFHDPTGKRLQVHENERMAKYLLNERYVPSNFNALLLGASSSTNWDLTRITSAKVYNESIYGGNITEEKLLANQAMKRGHFRYVLCLLTPDITSKDGFNEASGRPTHREALGSINLLREEFAAFRQAHGRPSIYYSNGDEEMLAPRTHDETIPELWRHLDPVALAQYHQLLDELHAAGTQVIFVRPPMAGYLYHMDQPFFDNHAAVAGLIGPTDLYIDLMQPKYASFYNDPTNFNDNVHPTHEAGLQIGSMLNAELEGLRASGKLR